MVNAITVFQILTLVVIVFSLCILAAFSWELRNWWSDQP